MSKGRAPDALMPSGIHRKLYDLAGTEDDRRTSPPCWSTRLALAHKGLEYESVPWRRVEKDTIGFSGQGLVPVLVDGDQVVHDSWQIAEYLDKTYTDKPMGLKSPTEKAGINFTKHWLGHCVYPTLVPLLYQGALDVSADKDKEYFVNKIESMTGTKFSEYVVEPTPEHLARFQKSLEPMRLLLSDQPFFGGSEPKYADLAVAGAFAWARAVSPTKLLARTDPVFTWRERVFERYHGCVFDTIGYDYA